MTNHFKLQENYKLEKILDIGNNETALMLVHKNTYQIKFYQLKEFNYEVRGKTVQVLLTKLGYTNSSKLQVDEDSDDDTEENKDSVITSVRFNTTKKDEKFKHTALVLRKSGHFEFYSDFNLVKIEKEKGKRCSMIETDNENYFVLIKEFN